ncbi:hypothetical protein BZA77DRAFT_365946 [Pyronema omphalodes]|nr:hypothetical protein BZA77DRAFT_365946 [Pyronema omphalodes]
MAQLLPITAVWWTCVAVTGLVVFIRLWYIFFARKRIPAAIADGFMILTWIASLVMVCLMTDLDAILRAMKIVRQTEQAALSGNTTAVGPSPRDIQKNTPMPVYIKASQAMVTESFQRQFVISILYAITLWSAKATLFSIYWAVRSVVKNRNRILLYLGIAYTAGTFLIIFFTTLFWCGPDLSKNWTMGPNRQLCLAVAATPVMLMSTIATLTTDVIIIIIGVIVVRNMQFAQKRWELYALTFVFGIGIFTIASILVRFSFVIDITRNNARFSRWMAVECMCSLVACCLPTARSLFRRVPDKLSSGKSTGSSSLGSSPLRTQGSEETGVASKSMESHEEYMEKEPSVNVVPEMRSRQPDQPRLTTDGRTYV